MNLWLGMSHVRMGVRSSRALKTLKAAAETDWMAVPPRKALQLAKNLKLVRDTLQVKGYQTIEAETGEEGVRLAHERQPALILMDIQLPGISGVAALRELRADPVTSSTPVIAITASVMTQDRTRIMAAGFNGFQGKPISVRELLAAVRETLDKP